MLPVGFPRMRRILHVIPTLDGGGAERQLALLAAEQVRRGDAVHIALRRRGVNASAAEQAGVVLHELGEFRSLHPGLVRAIHRLCRRLRPDLLQSWLPQADACGGLAARMAGVPWVMTERASAAAYRATAPCELARRVLAPAAHAVVANSRGGAAYWQGRSSRISVIGNAIDFEAIRACAATAGPRPPGRLVLSVGRFVPGKGQQAVIAAFARLQREALRLRLVGGGPLRADLQRLADASGAGARIEVGDYSASWWNWLVHADALISLSEHEGAPNVVLEAMAAGVPLVVSDIPAHREILDDSCASFVPLGDDGEAARALAACLDQPQQSLARAAEAGRRAAAHTIAEVARSYATVYARVLDGARLPCAD